MKQMQEIKKSANSAIPPPYRKARFLATHKRQIILALSIIVFIVALFLRLGFAYQKSGFHIDESASISISTGHWVTAIKDGTYFGKELKERLYFNDNSLRDLAHDLGELWKNNYGDGAAHPNLYYILLRVWNFDVKSGNFDWLKSRGIGLNLVFFALGFYATFILISKIFSRQSLLVPLFLAMIFWNSASVSNTIFVRPYALQEMLFLVFALNCFVFYRLGFANTKEAFTCYKLFFAWFIFATALLCLSHYFSLFFIAFAFIFLVLISQKNIVPLIIVLLGSIVIAQIFYIGYFDFLNGYHAKDGAVKLLFIGFWDNLTDSVSAGAEILSAHFCNVYGFAILCVAFGIALYYRIFTRNAMETNIFLLGFFSVACVWFALVLFVAPFKVLRYVMPIFPFLYFGVIFVLNGIKKPLLQGILGVGFVASLFINYTVEYLYKEPFIFTQNKNLPVLLHFPRFHHEGYFTFAFDDVQIYIAESDLARLQEKMREFDVFYLLSEAIFKPPLGYKQSSFQTYINTDVKISEHRERGHFHLFEKDMGK